MRSKFGYPCEIQKVKIKPEEDITNRARFIPLVVTILMAGLILVVFVAQAKAGEVWEVTSYCSCVKCCNKSDGITASGKQAKYGYVACNWLPFGTKVKIKGLGEFIVMDRGAKSLFGSKRNHIKHLDVYMSTHKQARNFGVKYLEVTVL